MPLFCEPLEGRRLLSATVSAGRPATLTDADGSLVTFTLAGPGVADVAVDGDAYDVAITGAGPRTAVGVKVVGGDGGAVIDDLSADAPLARVHAPAATLTGDVVLPAVKSLAVGAVAGATISAGSLGAVSVAGSFAGGRVDAPRVASLTVGGDMTDAWVGLYPLADSQPQGLGRLTVRGQMRGTTVDALTDVGTVTTGAMLNSHVVAGVRFARADDGSFAPVLPKDRAADGKEFDFTGTYTIAAVTVTGKGPAGVSFKASKVAAHTLGRVSLNEVAGTTGTGEMGVSGFNVWSVRRKYEAAHRRLNASQNGGPLVVNQIKEPLPFVPGENGGHGTYGALMSGLLQDPLGRSYGAIDAGSSSVIISTQPASRAPVTYPTTLNVLVGSVSNSPATGIYLITDGTYDVRDAGGNVLSNVPDLHTAIVGLVGAPGKSIKQRGTTLLTTSVGPSVDLIASQLGSTNKIEAYPRRTELVTRPVVPSTYPNAEYVSTARAWYHDVFLEMPANAYRLMPDGSLIPLAAPIPDPPTAAQPAPTEMELVEQVVTVDRSVPTLAALAGAITDVGYDVKAYNSLRMLTEDPLSLGARTDAGRSAAVVLSPGLTIGVGGEDAPTVLAALLGDDARAGGSRRMPVRLKVADGKVHVYGLARGGTAVLAEDGENVLNPEGDVLTVPTAGQVKQAIVDTGLAVDAFGV